MNFPYRNSASRRGSLLIVAMILSAIIGISLVSYLHLSRSTQNISNRAVYANAAVNLAEQGIEEAMYSVNRMVANPSYDWTNWAKTTSNPNAYREWTNVTLSQNATASYRVFIYNYTGVAAPKVISRARVKLGGTNAAPIEKWIEVVLRKTSKFANGLVAKNSITFDGNNPTVDSWNSVKDHNTGALRPSPVAFSNGVRNDNGSVGSISISNTAIVVQNADIYGYVGTGGADPTGFVKANGSITGDDTAMGTKIDPTRISTSFSATFEEISIPTVTAITNLGAINDDLVLPRADDVTNNRAVLDPSSPGDTNKYYFYDAASISLVSKVLAVDDPTHKNRVVIRLSSTAGISVSGTGEINIGSNGFLAIYTDGTVNIAGKGVSNGVESHSPPGLQEDELGQPVRFQLWGTKTSPTQSISIAGTGLFSGIIYAPYGNVSITGNGAVCGSVVANNITLGGNCEFHYDESLADLGGDSPFRIGKWKELTTATERNVYSSVINW